MIDPERQLESVARMPAGAGDASVVDETVDAPAARDQLLRRRAHRREIGEIQRQNCDAIRISGPAQLGGQRLASLV